MKKVAYCFIDASNIIYGAKDSGWFIDQKKLFGYMKKKYHARKIFFYFGQENNNPRQQKFLRKLKQFGFTLRVKQVKHYGKRRKANCDVDLTMDALLLASKFTHAIFLTGDGDFCPLFIHLRKIKKVVTIISWPRRTARELRRFAGEEFVDMTSLRYLVERRIKKGKTLK